ncbi:catechol 2,3-dioxygenase-like lactoylglutathione lyase family enzyme [Nocardioides daedukensis]|uniref:Catechol 2,3-dioxygenase-like lactoylglutathione lyase family enzyme n=1 Tax=Nocardioides daedukensis TaxID=634462 RepID=A0A7Y9RYL8_9ACTN|nr:VOC family protein [Nocardioides daedukensis]NYG58645.1 catechol 2,3-dioxygenase-like lactoylglutathione lyase family enzyme [Nocardioides daedukensis]
MRLHHVQVACPRGGEEDARRFYGTGLGLVEVPKPAALSGRGGCWWRSYDASGQVVAELHIGVEEPFAPALKAHPALVLDSVADLEDVADRLQRLGFEVDWSERYTFEGHQRCHTRDAHGNRVELLA